MKGALPFRPRARADAIVTYSIFVILRRCFHLSDDDRGRHWKAGTRLRR